MFDVEVHVYVPNNCTYNLTVDIFQKSPRFLVHNSSITQTTADAIISAGNSFAQLNGGVDGIINTFLSAYSDEYIQDTLRRVIAFKYSGELPVGSAETVTTKHPNVTRLIYAPTMRVAEKLPKSSINAYLAFRVALLECKKHKIKTVATPLMCTGAGEMSTEKACKQMLEAYKTIRNDTLCMIEWPEIHAQNRQLCEPPTKTVERECQTDSDS